MIKLKPGVFIRSIMQEVLIERGAVIIDTNTSTYLRLNETAWEMLDILLRADENAAVLELTNRIDVSCEVIKKDICLLITRLKDLALIDEHHLNVEYSPVSGGIAQ